MQASTGSDLTGGDKALGSGSDKRAEAPPDSSTSNADRPIPADEVFAEALRSKVRAYLDLNLRDYVLATRDVEAVQQAALGHLAALDAAWHRRQPILSRLHEAKLASGAVETIPADQEPPASGDGIYITCGVFWDPASRRDVRKFSRTGYSEDPDLLVVHGEMEELKSALRRLLLSNLTPRADRKKRR